MVRHGESEANVDRNITSVVPDHALHLTEKGRGQAHEAGEMLKELLGDQTVHFIVSPYVRTRETFNGIAHAWGGAQDLRWSQEVLIREQEYGNYDKPNMAELHRMKLDFGQFYYRFPEGESVVDVYNRAGMFVNDLYRRWERAKEENLVLVSHGIFLLAFLMRFFRYTVKDFYELAALKNCEVIVLEREDNASFLYLKGTWVPGSPKVWDGKLRRKADVAAPETDIWDGEPDAPTMTGTRSLIMTRAATSAVS